MFLLVASILQYVGSLLAPFALLGMAGGSTDEPRRECVGVVCEAGSAGEKAFAARELHMYNVSRQPPPWMVHDFRMV